MIRVIGSLAAVTLAAVPLATPHSGESTSPGATCAVTQAVRAVPPSDPNADPFGAGPWYVNADRSIWAGWDAAGMAEGENKVLWIRPRGTQLTVSGRRLDAESSPMSGKVPCCYPTGFQASGLIFPSEGCWEVTAKAGTSEFTFVTSVGPARPAR